MDIEDSLSPDLRRKLDIVKGLAQQAETGRVFFIEVSHKPVVSLFVETNEIIDNKTQLHNVSLKLANEPESYSKFRSICSNHDLYGFNKYNQILSLDNNKIIYDEYKTKVDEVFSDIDNAKMKYHGIMCYEDGDRTNTEARNVFVLHVCDVMNLIISRRQGNIPRLLLNTTMMSSIEDSMDCDQEATFISEKN